MRAIKHRAEEGAKAEICPPVCARNGRQSRRIYDGRKAALVSQMLPKNP